MLLYSKDHNKGTICNEKSEYVIEETMVKVVKLEIIYAFEQHKSLFYVLYVFKTICFLRNE